MDSLIYFYSKFTEEFLLLSAAGVFTLLSIYCYHWVIQKRRLGIARSQIPSSVVKSYLSQLIGEAEFVRKQLFGMTDGNATYAPTAGSFSLGTSITPASEGNQQISPDLLARVNALEAQLKEKEGLVVNINIEKTKLLDEIEKLKANPGAAAASGASGANDQLAQKVKNLEARLEEYALFEEDLANLKRLQQENTQLKKKMVELGGSPDTAITVPASPKAEPEAKKTLSAVPDLPVEPSFDPPAEAPKHALDPDAIESLLDGKPAVPPSAEQSDPLADMIPEAAAVAAPASDQFEKLVDSVETSLDIPAAEPVKAAAPEPAPAPVAPAAKTPAPAVQAAEPPKAAAPAATAKAAAPAPESPLANKTDEELLKEFENLLNS